MDFVEGLPTSGRANAIMVVVTGTLSLLISLPCTIRLLPLQWLGSFWTMCFVFMACQSPLTEIESLRASFGNCYSLWPAQLYE
jgi:hypothetical protein